MNITKIALSSAILLAPLAAHAGGEVDFALSNNSIRLEHAAVMVGTGAYLSTGLLYSEDAGNWAITAGFNAVDATMANKELIGGLGFKGMLLSTSYADLSVGIGVGGFLRWQPDFMNGLGVEGQGFYAPSILSFGELVDAYEGVARITYKVLPQAKAFVGYHVVAGQYDLEVGANETENVDSTFHIGFRIVY